MLEVLIVEKQGDLLFTLDIGTRTVIGLVMEFLDGNFEILASYVVEHEERAMLDGQIHNVNLVSQEVKKVKDKLEDTLGIKLERVSIAAAGRALKTVNFQESLELEEKRLINEEDVQALEFSAIHRAQAKLASTPAEDREIRDYHFVGHTVQEYYLDGMLIGSLEGQRGKLLKVKIIATFLPRIVVDSLLTVVNKLGLEVEYLTLEPIAVANAVIPKDMHNFNLALVDIGAGTSDIAITKAGSMFAYAMVPIAGDEITEAISGHYLLDYNTGEMIKRSLMTEKEITVRNILSQEITISTKEILEEISSVIESLASQISEAILMYNDKAPQAVICVGGGSLTPNLLKGIASYLDIHPSRVAIKEYSDIKNVTGKVEGVSNAQSSTPIGIGLSSHNNKSKVAFLDININQVKHQLFTLNKASISDAMLAADIDFRQIYGNPGMGITCTVNGKLKVIKGEMGEPGKIVYNGQEINDLEQEIKSGDEIEFTPGRPGTDARAIIGDIIPDLESFSLNINQENIMLKPEIYQNSCLVDKEAELEDGAEIEYDSFNTIRDVISKVRNKEPEDILNDFVSYTINGSDKYLPQGDLLVLLDNNPVDLDIPIEEGMELEILEKESSSFSSRAIIDSKVSDTITIRFNNSTIKIPVENKLYCNGEKIENEREIKNGDKLSYQEKKITVHSVFKHINYKVTPYLNNFQLFINGEKADFDQEVKDGDHLKLVYEKDL